MPPLAIVACAPNGTSGAPTAGLASPLRIGRVDEDAASLLRRDSFKTVIPISMPVSIPVPTRAFSDAEWLTLEVGHRACDMDDNGSRLLNMTGYSCIEAGRGMGFSSAISNRTRVTGRLRGPWLRVM